MKHLSSCIAAVQMTSGLEVATNLEQAAHLIAQAAQAGAQLIVLPEMFPLMGATESAKLAVCESPGVGPIQAFLAAQALKHQVWLVGGSIPLKADIPGKTYNTCFVYDALGEQVARYDKIHLFDVTVKPDIEVYQESATVTAGEKIVMLETPFGKLGLAICYDLRFPELFRALSAQGVEIFAVPAAFTVKTGQAHWELLMRARAVENFCYVVGSCQSGTHENQRHTYGHSMIVDPWGEVIACLVAGTGFISATIDISKLRQIRANIPALEHRRLK